MGMVVRSNIMALNANRQLGMNNSQVAKNLEKLSSGFRINRAGDDASGLAISEKMKAQIKGLETASMNSQDGISLIQTAEGNLTEVHDMLNRMVELAEKSANGTMEVGTAYGNGGTDRDALQAEMDALATEIDRIADSANFNNIKLLDGSLLATGVNRTNTDVTANDAGDFTFDLSGITIGEDGDYTFATGDAGASVVIALKKGDTGEQIAEALLAASKDTGSLAGFVKSIDGSKVTFDTAGAAAAVGGGGATHYSLSAENLNGTGAANTVTKGETFAYDFGQLDYEAIKKGINDAVAPMTYTLNVGTGTFTLDAANAALLGDSLEDLLDNVASAINADGGAGTYFTAAPSGGAMFEASVKGNKLVLTALEDGNNATVVPGKMDVTYTDAGGATHSTLLGIGEKQNNGLILQIGDTSETFNKMEVSVADMHMNAMFRGSNIKDKDTGNATLVTLASGSTSLDISTQDVAGAAMTAVKKVINTVSSQRANLGALQNRLEHTINNLDVAAENMNAANSRIRDTDMAKQMMDYTKMNVLTQAAQAMLAQANQQPQSILQLLQ